MIGRGLGAVAAGVVLVGTAVGWSPMVGAATPPAATPLTSAVTTPSLSSVSLAMGHLADPVNTFWELFVRPAGATSWVLRTPPGVADNGGLAVGVPTTGPLMVGFLPSQLLRFSPLATSADAGKTWSPAELPSALVAAPDVLVGGTGNAGTALVTGSGQTVLSSSDLTSWHPVVTTRTLAKTVTGCGVQRISAVVSDGEDPILGVQCSQPNRVGVLFPPPTTSSNAGGRSTWTSGGPLLSGASGTATVLRLEATGTGGANGLTGLARVQSGARSSLVGFWSQGVGPTWTQSTRLAVPTGWTVLATATGGATGQGIVVLLGSGHSRRVVSTTGPGAAWVTASTPPVGTAAVAAVGSEIDAFVVSTSHLAVWALRPGAGWSRSQTTTVAIPYGSSG
jgi:hypothetical protein